MRVTINTHTFCVCVCVCVYIYITPIASPAPPLAPPLSTGKNLDLLSSLPTTNTETGPNTPILRLSPQNIWPSKQTIPKGSPPEQHALQLLPLKFLKSLKF
ncbi:hypothetical protein ATANTOWER_012334 [Ataeniobius toweri]|uniref:Uncharacterized protein n=1 Tax=Ataeniobius toweri TaxID=208326 RepID=A0ABU7AF18_9TELE|nr:hypothetical protein [Ataeniobius toweri]